MNVQNTMLKENNTIFSLYAKPAQYKNEVGHLIMSRPHFNFILFCVNHPSDTKRIIKQTI